jgi:multimeric flavodoxin WrbA
MSQPIVLVTFSCLTGETEKLALSAAVGAVQARALIRLRRIPDVDPATANAEVVRMRKEYVPPAEADIVGADALIFAAGADTAVLSAPWQEFLNLLLRLSKEDKLGRKVGASIGGIPPALGALGFLTVTQLSSDPLALGRSVAEMARSLKSS